MWNQETEEMARCTFGSESRPLTLDVHPSRGNSLRIVRRAFRLTAPSAAGLWHGLRIRIARNKFEPVAVAVLKSFAFSAEFLQSRL